MLLMVRVSLLLLLLSTVGGPSAPLTPSQSDVLITVLSHDEVTLVYFPAVVVTRGHYSTRQTLHYIILHGHVIVQELGCRNMLDAFS